MPTLVFHSKLRKNTPFLMKRLIPVITNIYQVHFVDAFIPLMVTGESILDLSNRGRSSVTLHGP